MLLVCFNVACLEFKAALCPRAPYTLIVILLQNHAKQFHLSKGDSLAS